MLIMTISQLTLAEIDAIIIGVQVVAFICVTIGMIVMVFLKTNKDSILMGYGPKEIEREINLLQSALDGMNNGNSITDHNSKQAIKENQ
jgi:sensor histidine kinase regulating citrate/malate metabolism